MIFASKKHSANYYVESTPNYNTCRVGNMSEAYPDPDSSPIPKHPEECRLLLIYRHDRVKIPMFILCHETFLPELRAKPLNPR